MDVETIWLVTEMFDARVLTVIEKLEAFMRTVDDALAVPRDAGEFLHAMVLACGAKRAVEIGTSYGYSGLWISAALKASGGRLITIDMEPRKSEAAGATFNEAGLSEWVELRTGRALDVLPSISGPIDFVLNDADKKNCIAYIELLMPKLADRAIVLTDNTRTHPGELGPVVDWLKDRSEFFTTDLNSVGNGMALSVFRRPIE